MFNLASAEAKILKFWQDKDIFQKTLQKKSPQGDYVFYDGPPFATGTPHYGHLVASLMKDVVPRYWTMKGYHVDRKWGWDTHGLPIENIVEKELNLKNKQGIEKLGVAKFNNACQSKVMLYADEWKKVINRLGRFVDMDNDYKTMDLDYMESIWWVFKELWDKGLIYQDYKSMHICPRCETTLSQSEVAQGYLDIKDISVIAKFELVDEPNIFVLAWTTTPWTLPGNAALAVGEDVKYVKIKISPLSSKLPVASLNGEVPPTFTKSEGAEGYREESYILAKANLETILKNKKYKILSEFKGKDLVGKAYKPLFPYFDNDKLENRDNAWKIYAADFVTIEDGTGIVHIAPAFGEDDMNLGKKENLPFIQHVKMDGHFTDEVLDFKDLEVKPKNDTQATDVKIIKYLAAKNLLFAKAKYEHSYPHCWRCDTPLLNYATTSWFVNVTKIKDKAMENAKDINWTPAHIKEGRFGNWLEGARDWSISRQRFWGSVMPIWECQKCDNQKVLGSIKELEKLSGQTITNLHKHIIDAITFKCSKCDGQMKRIPDVLDCWFESGSMPYAQMHYPFENKNKFEKNFPAEFIGEGVDQTRTWFYYLHILATALKDKPAFKNVIANGIVLAADGKKMSKKLQNYPDPMEIMNKYGADALRYYLTASPVMRAEDINFSAKDMIEQSRFINTLANVLSFFQIFAGKIDVQNIAEEALSNVLDKWIIAKLNELIRRLTKRLDNYELNAIRDLAEFIENLSTWYVRRSRDRFKGEDIKDKVMALRTLEHTLLTLSKLMAPFMPFLAEHLYKELNGELESVHLESWPEFTEELINNVILEKMNISRKIIELGLAKRDEVKIKVRQPLGQATIFNAQIEAEYIALIKAELNIKEIKFAKNSSSDISVEISTQMTPELESEGLYRELVRTINQMRKQQQLTIEDKVVVEYNSDDKIIQAVFVKFNDDLKKSTLADKLEISDSDLEKIKINDKKIGLKITKI